jgi:predicted alpha/beta-fold hydrolase
LLINAKDDPLAVSPLPDGAFDNPSLTAVQPDHGGHVGFVAGSILHPRYWAERIALEFLSTFG